MRPSGGHARASGEPKYPTIYMVYHKYCEYHIIQYEAPNIIIFTHNGLDSMRWPGAGSLMSLPLVTT